MAKNLISGHSGELKYTLTGTVASSQLIDVGGAVGLVMVGGVSGDVVTVQTMGKVRYAKAAEAFTAGEKLYYHAGNDNLTTTSAGALYAGICAEDAASGDAEGVVNLMPGEKN